MVVELAGRDCPTIFASRPVMAYITAAQRIGWDLTAGRLFPVVTTERFPGPSASFSSSYNGRPALQGHLFAGGRAAESLHDALLSRGRLPQHIADRNGGGRDHEEWWLEDGIDSKMLHRGLL